MAAYPQSVAYTRSFKMIDSSDHLSKKTGLTCTVNISKAGAAFGAAAGAVAEVANGWYKVSLTAADTGTLGDLAFYITASGADDTDFCDQVIDAAKGLGAPSNLDAAVTSRMATYSQPTGFLAATFPSGTIASTTNITAGTITTVTTLTNLPAITSGWITAAGINADTGLIIRANTATASSSNSLTLDGSASAIANFYRDCWLVITGGTGVGQVRRISAHSTGRVSTVSPAWDITPATNCTFAILPFNRVDIDAILGTVSVGAVGYMGIDWNAISGPTSTVNLSNTTIGTVTSGGSGPTAAAIATAVFTDLMAGSDFSTVGSFGKLIKDDIDAAISSRSSYAGGDTSGTTTLLARLTNTRAGYFDNLSGGAVALASSLPTNFAALGISVGGHISNVDVLTTYTGDTPQTGDSYARIGAAGVGLTNLGDTRLAHLDADISSRSTYAGADTPGTTTLLAGVTLLDNAITANKIASNAITDAKIAVPAETAGRPTTILAMLRRIWEWSANKRTRDQGTGIVLLRNHADSGNLESQTQSTTSSIDTQTEGS